MLALIISTLACLEPSPSATLSLTDNKGHTENVTFVEKCRPNLPLPPFAFTPVIPADQPPLNNFKTNLKGKAERDRLAKMKAEDKG